MKELRVKIDSDLHQMLKEQAKAKGVSLSAMIREQLGTIIPQDDTAEVIDKPTELDKDHQWATGQTISGQSPDRLRRYRAQSSNVPERTAGGDVYELSKDCHTVFKRDGVSRSHGIKRIVCHHDASVVILRRPNGQFMNTKPCGKNVSSLLKDLLK